MTDREHFANTVLQSITENGDQQTPIKNMTPAQAAAIARRIAVAYFPNGGIPNGTGFIAGLIRSVYG